MKHSAVLIILIFLCWQTGFAQEKPDEKIVPCEIVQKKKDPNEPYYFASIEVKPSFPGSFESEVLKEIDITDNDVPYVDKVRVYVSFVIETDGSLSQVRLVRDPGYGIGKETLEAVKKVKIKWQPGLHNGKPVRVSYTLPVEIKIPTE